MPYAHTRVSFQGEQFYRCGKPLLPERGLDSDLEWLVYLPPAVVSFIPTFLGQLYIGCDNRNSPGQFIPEDQRINWRVCSKIEPELSDSRPGIPGEI